MSKPSLLYASPFPPIESGISWYSEKLIVGLAEFFEVTLLIDDYNIQSKSLKPYKTLVYTKGATYAQYDFIIYNIGNQPYYHGYMVDCIKDNPGYVIVHDVSLYYLMADHYQKHNTVFSKIYQQHGCEGVRILRDAVLASQSSNLLEFKHLADKLTLNREILQRALGILVHSEYAKLALWENGITCPIARIHLVDMSDGKEHTKKEVYSAAQKFGIPDDAFVVGSAGFIAPSKQNELVCNAVKLYNETHNKKIYYLMVGDGAYVDHLLDKYCIKTGFVNREDYNRLLARFNIVANLRNPYNGETSATLIELLSMGKFCAVTDIGWFSELSDNVVIKMKEDATDKLFEEVLSVYANNPKKWVNQAGKDFVQQNCTCTMVARSIRDVLHQKVKR